MNDDSLIDNHDMNSDHEEVCSSEEWAEYIRDEVLPAAFGTVDLGAAILEIGPGYGAATRWLTTMVDELTVLEVNNALAAELQTQYPDVQVTRGSGTAMPYDDTAFDGVVCFTMLDHVESGDDQGAIFAEAFRVVRPGGQFVGSDSVASPNLAEFHRNDTYNPVDPVTLPERLQSAGFVEVGVEVTGEDRPLLTFQARRSS